jgi:prepilin-type N-terminal cleavage/methylation domain-containing protein
VSAKRDAGFTIVEVLVAVLILAFGVTALVGSSAIVTRQVGRGRITTIATEVATQRLEYLRREGARLTGTPPRPCTSGNFTSSGSANVTRGVSETWTVGTSGQSRAVSVIVAYPRGTGDSGRVTLNTIIGCY